MGISFHLPIIISCVALALSVLQFYFNNLRHPRALYLTCTQGCFPFPGLALMNAGKSDVIVLGLSFLFEDGSSTVWLQQELDGLAPDSLLIPAGRGIHTKIRFSNPFTPEFVTRGIPSDGECYGHQLVIAISWIQDNGKVFSRVAQVAKVFFNSQARVSGLGDLLFEPVNLYRLKPRKVSIFRRSLGERLKIRLMSLKFIVLVSGLMPKA